jgi:hypothetical protein
MIKRFVIFLIRKRLGAKKLQQFTFSNQKKSAVYWFTDTKLMKTEKGEMMPSNVCLNWLLDDNCSIIPVE